MRGTLITHRLYLHSANVIRNLAPPTAKPGQAGLPSFSPIPGIAFRSRSPPLRHVPGTKVTTIILSGRHARRPEEATIIAAVPDVTGRPRLGRAGEHGVPPPGLAYSFCPMW